MAAARTPTPRVQESATSDGGEDAAITSAFATSWAQGIQVWASALGPLPGG